MSDLNVSSLEGSPEVTIRDLLFGDVKEEDEVSSVRVLRWLSYY